LTAGGIVDEVGDEIECDLDSGVTDAASPTYLKAYLLWGKAVGHRPHVLISLAAAGQPA